MTSQHILSLISQSLGILGSFYLAYDLLGRPSGILRRITVILPCSLAFMLYMFTEMPIQWQYYEMQYHLHHEQWTYSPLGVLVIVLICFLFGGVFGNMAFDKMDENIKKAEHNKSIGETNEELPAHVAFKHSIVLIFKMTTWKLPLISMVGASILSEVIEILIILGSAKVNFNMVILAAATPIAIFLFYFIRFYLIEGLPYLAVHLSERFLGAIGAFLTLCGFLIQLIITINN